MVEPGDQQRLLPERVAAARGLDHLLGEDLEVEAELLPQLVLPLLDQAAGRDDQAALDVAADHQLLAEEPRHDRLAGARVVSQQVAQRLAREHLAVDRIDLVGQRIEVRGLHGQERIKQVGERDPLGLRHETEQRAVRIHRPRPPDLLDAQPRLVVAVEELLVRLAGRVIGVRERDGVRSVPLNVDDLYGAVGQNPSDKSTLGQVFKSSQCPSTLFTATLRDGSDCRESSLDDLAWGSSDRPKLSPPGIPNRLRRVELALKVP